MKGKLFSIARAYMIDLFNEMNDYEFDPTEFDKYETEHVTYDYEEYVDGFRCDGTLVVYVDGVREFTCTGNIVS